MKEPRSTNGGSTRASADTSSPWAPNTARRIARSVMSRNDGVVANAAPVGQRAISSAAISSISPS